MPLDDEFGPQIHSSNADLQNVSSMTSFRDQLLTGSIFQTGGRPAGSATAALFLKPFAEGCEGKDGEEPTMKWAHIDIAGSMEVRPF